jgi:hypothetical protein
MPALWQHTLPPHMCQVLLLMAQSRALVELPAPCDRCSASLPLPSRLPYPLRQSNDGGLHGRQKFGIRIAFSLQQACSPVGQAQTCGVRRGQAGGSLVRAQEGRMAEHQPRKAGEYERPRTESSSSLALLIGLIAVLTVIVIAVLFLR